MPRFLLAQLHLDSLMDQTTPRAITRALQSLPSGSSALYKAHQNAIQRIQGQKSNFQVLAWRALSWITCARRPLTVIELQHALAVEPGDTELGEDNLLDIEETISLCAGLVTIDYESDIVRLVHYTTQEYFEQTKNTWSPNAEIDIAMTCVTYLLFDAFNTGFCATDNEFYTRLGKNVLYNYAAQNWGHHARKASAEGALAKGDLAGLDQLIVNFLESRNKVSSSIQAMMSYEFSVLPDYRPSQQVTGVHLAAYFGVEKGITALIMKGRDINTKDSFGRTPLSHAAANGHEAVVLLLLKKGAELEARDNYSRTPLL